MEWLIEAGGNAENLDKYDCITSTRKAGNVNLVLGVSLIVYGIITEEVIPTVIIQWSSANTWSRQERRIEKEVNQTFFAMPHAFHFQQKDIVKAVRMRIQIRMSLLTSLSLGYRLAITKIVYILVLSVMVRKRHRQLSCYKIMIVLGFYDMCEISLDCLLSGYFHLTGANYCVNATLSYITGDLAIGLWCGACLNCLVLVVNRLLDIWDRQYMEMFFKGKRTYFVLLLPFAYLLYFTLFTRPLLFNSDHTGWFFIPFTTNHKIEEYVNLPQIVNNLLIVALTTLLYVLYAKLLLRSSRGSKLSWAQKSFFFQTTSICMATLVASLVYVYMQFFETQPYFILIGHAGWTLSNGLPAFVYLILNRTIGGEVLKTLRIRKWKISAIATTNASKAVASTAPAVQA